MWGTAVQGELQRLEDELYADDVAEARARLGRDEVGPGELARTPAQRRAAALVRMAERSRSAPAGGRRPEPLVTVVVGLDDAVGHLCELDDGTVLTRAQFLPLLERADIESIVFDSAQRALSVSVRERFFTGALRRVIQVRDRHCQHPSGCDVPAGRCQVDHIVPWEAGGPTTQANGRLLCGPHNRARTARPPPRSP
ncbi:MAG: HNH endonuclease [Acidimicrobiales bacterium]|nr:HNH endonuclease [Acidimicrobiales bacterium]